MSSKQIQEVLNQNILEIQNKSEQNSIIENDFIELTNEIDKIRLEQKDLEEMNSQFEKYTDDEDFNSTKIYQTQFSFDKNNIQNQKNLYQLFNNLKNNQINFDNTNIYQNKNISQFSKKDNSKDENNNVIIMNNFINNNLNYFEIYNPNIQNNNFSNYHNQIINNNIYNRYSTPNFNYINDNNQLTPIFIEHQFYSPIIPYNNLNMNFSINNINNNNENIFQSLHVNNLKPNNENTNDEQILKKMITKQSKFKKSQKNLNTNISYNNNNPNKFQNFINNNNINKNINNKTNQNLNLITKNQNQTKKQNQKEEKNIIDIQNIILQKDKRTTIMIKNIPNKYTISTFLEEINIDFKNKYDIFYLPIDYTNKCNLGFAFINFVDSFHIIEFYDNYRGKKWKKFNSDKICELLYAKFQGKKELINHYEKGKFLSYESEDKRPLILPTPNPFPKISIPVKFLDLFKCNYPFVKYSFNDNKEKFIFENLYF